MSSKKRYSKPYEIHSEILKLKRLAKVKLDDAQEHESTAKVCIDQANGEGITEGQRKFLLETAGHERNKAEKMRHLADLIEESQIPRLVRTLAELNTQPMEFIKNDPSVKRAS
jgi:hypothetical protein